MQSDNQLSFKERHPDFIERKAQAQKILVQYTDKIPVICEISNGSKLPKLEKSKFLIP